MKRPPILLSLSFALVLPAAAAAAPVGLNLGWKGPPGTECPSLGVTYECDPCDNTGLHVLVGSAVVPSGLTQVTGEEVYVSIEYASATVPNFWMMDTGSCRDGSIYVDTNFFGYSVATCQKYWPLTTQGGWHWYNQYNDPNYCYPSFANSASRLAAVFARPAGTQTAMAAGVEYYLFKATIDGARAAPDPSNPAEPVCSGCTIPACLVFSNAIIYQPVGVGDVNLTMQSTRNWVSWQDPSACGAVPAHRPTWGHVKSVYR